MSSELYEPSRECAWCRTPTHLIVNGMTYVYPMHYRDREVCWDDPDRYSPPALDRVQMVDLALCQAHVDKVAQVNEGLEIAPVRVDIVIPWRQEV